MRCPRWLGAAISVAVLATGSMVLRPAPAAAAPAAAMLLGDSVLESIELTPSARSLLSGHDVLIDAEVCRRLISTSCTAQGVTPNTALDALTASAGRFRDVLVVEAGYNDASIATAVDRIVAEARRQGIETVAWLTYHEGGANAATYARHNDTLVAKARVHPELEIIDFHGYSDPHPSWFAADGLHLTSAGAKGLATLIDTTLDRLLATPPPPVTPTPDPPPTVPTCTAKDPAPAPATTDVEVSGGLHALPVPVRFLDTRVALPEKPTGDAIHTVQITGNAGIPLDAVAVVATVTAVEPCGDAYLTVYPCDTSPPTASAVNASPGATVANGVLVRLSPGGALCVFANTGTHVLVDVAAWIGPDGLGLTPVVPVRLIDTRRSTSQRLDSPQQRLAAGAVLTVPIARDPMAADAAIVSVNLTAVEAAGPGYLTLYPGPCSNRRPDTSNLNVAARGTAAAGATTTVGADGTICVFTSVATDVIVDLNATALPGGAAVHPISPLRVADSRLTGARVRAGADVVIDLDDPPLGAPRGATGAVVNVTAVGPGGVGYVTVAPCQADGALPYVSNLNVATGTTAANLALVAAGDGRRICVRPTVITDLVIDVEGWIVPVPAAG